VHGEPAGSARGLAADVPVEIAWIYPLITDGLALVAYVATAQLRDSAARYAWSVVVLAAGLSGLGQACYLAGGVGASAPASLRFGVGAWPAVAAAIVAHLLHLLIASNQAERTVEQLDSGRTAPFNESWVEPAQSPSERPAIEAAGTSAVQPSNATSDSPARDRAQAAARRHAVHHGELPTVSQLMALAEVSRGTAGEALKTLRNQPMPLHLVDPNENTRTQP
jgi:hypothetical protein